jgi:hypothetical protein
MINLGAVSYKSAEIEQDTSHAPDRDLSIDFDDELEAVK